MLIPQNYLAGVLEKVCQCVLGVAGHGGHIFRESWEGHHHVFISRCGFRVSGCPALSGSRSDDGRLLFYECPPVSLSTYISKVRFYFLNLTGGPLFLGALCLSFKQSAAIQL